MKFKKFFVGFSSFIVTVAILFCLGRLIEISWLTFHYEFINNSEGFSFEAGSLLPIFIALVVSFFAEKIYLKKCEMH
ncbi:hypothetical protein ACWV26_09250 [Rummeliibacillus sp. JY-2-4R]